MVRVLLLQVAGSILALAEALQPLLGEVYIPAQAGELLRLRAAAVILALAEALLRRRAAVSTRGRAAARQQHLVAEGIQDPAEAALLLLDLAPTGGTGQTRAASQ